MKDEIVQSLDAADVQRCIATVVLSRKATAANSRGRQPTEHGPNKLFEPRSGDRFGCVSRFAAAALRLKSSGIASSAGLRPQLIADIASRLEDVTSPASQLWFRSDR